MAGMSYSETAIQPLSTPVPAQSASAQSPDTETIFPLPLTAYEHYMWLDDRPSHPMTFCIELMLEGELLNEPGERALELAIQRHPLLRANIRKRRFHIPCWVPSQTQPELNWYEGPAQVEIEPPEFLDLTRQPGLRCWFIAQPETPRILFQFHHAAVDGVGALEFIGDWLAYYGQLTAAAGEELPELAPIDFSRLKLRGHINPQSVSYLKILSGYIKHTLWNLTTLATPLVPSCTKEVASQKKQFPPFITRILDHDELQRIKKFAASKGVTPNEIYTAVMLQTYCRWNEARSARRKSHYRLCMPISLRTPDHDDSPSANIISYLLINLPAAQVRDFDATLKQVHRLSREVIGTQDGPTFIRNLIWMRRLPGMLPAVTGLPICFSTGVLANVGDVKRQFRGYFPQVKGKIKAGKLTMTGLLGAAPVRPLSGVASSVGTYARQLFINMNYDPTRLTARDTEELLDLFLRGLRELYVPE